MKGRNLRTSEQFKKTRTRKLKILTFTISINNKHKPNSTSSVELSKKLCLFTLNRSPLLILFLVVHDDSFSSKFLFITAWSHYNWVKKLSVLFALYWRLPSCSFFYVYIMCVISLKLLLKMLLLSLLIIVTLHMCHTSYFTQFLNNWTSKSRFLLNYSNNMFCLPEKNFTWKFCWKLWCTSSFSQYQWLLLFIDIKI